MAPRFSFRDLKKKRTEGKGGGSGVGFPYGCTDPSTRTGTWLRTRNHYMARGNERTGHMVVAVVLLLQSAAHVTFGGARELVGMKKRIGVRLHGIVSAPVGRLCVVSVLGVTGREVRFQFSSAVRSNCPNVEWHHLETGLLVPPQPRCFLLLLSVSVWNHNNFFLLFLFWYNCFIYFLLAPFFLFLFINEKKRNVPCGSEIRAVSARRGMVKLRHGSHMWNIMCFKLALRRNYILHNTFST